MAQYKVKRVILQNKHGVVSIALVPILGSCDHQRGRAEGWTEKLVPKSEFAVERTRGKNVVRQDYNVWLLKRELKAASKFPPPPKAGPGRNDGRGTFQMQIYENYKGAGSFVP